MNIKTVAFYVCLASVGFGVAGLLAGFAQIWLPALVVGALAALVGIFHGADIDWQEVARRRQDERRSRMTTVGSATGTSHSFTEGWGSAAGGFLKENILWFLGSSLMFLGVVKMVRYEDFGDIMIGLTLFGFGIFVLLAKKGKVGEAAKDWLNNYKALTLLGVSILICIYAGFAYHEGGRWILTSLLGFATGVLAVAAMIGKLPEFLAAVGRVVRGAFGFEYNASLSLVLWGIAIFLIGAAVFDLEDVTGHFGDLSSYTAGSVVWLGFWALIFVGIVAGLAEAKKKFFR